MTHSDDELANANRRFEALAESMDIDSVNVDDTSDLRAIAEAADAVKAAQALLNERVIIARARGRSWNRIAIPLGVSRQAARERFGGARNESSDAPEAQTAASDLMSALEASLEAVRAADTAQHPPRQDPHARPRR